MVLADMPKGMNFSDIQQFNDTVQRHIVDTCSEICSTVDSRKRYDIWDQSSKKNTYFDG
jgi:hypothetical protein